MYLWIHVHVQFKLIKKKCDKANMSTFCLCKYFVYMPYMCEYSRRNEIIFFHL